ncbi:MAG: hypothetical protein ACI9OJ_005640 [Myxococcota bacterium]|jgi:hypothetical protein
MSLTNPFANPWHQTGLELVVYVLFALTVRHAWTRHKAGESYHLFQWLAMLLYGLIMELVSFNLFQNYRHATFSVQFYQGQLPLYITCIYLVFHYTGIKMVERLHLPRFKEGLLCGLAIMCIDVPYDMLGVDAGWWVWFDNVEAALHPRFVEAVSTRWFGVPVTSYYWYLMYGALLSIFSRFAWARLKGASLTRKLAAAPLVSVAVVVAGALAFEVMFWAPRALGASDHAIVGTYLALVLCFAALVRAPKAESAPRWLVAMPLAFHGYHLIILAWLWSRGDFSDGLAKTAIVLSAATVTMALMLTRQSKPEPSTA